jgi:tetratricopeptide (TPR) repeat protein
VKGLATGNRAKITRAVARFEAASRSHQAGDIPGAIAQYQRALSDAPHFAPGHMILGLALATHDRLDEAEASLRRALALDPTLADAHLGIGKLRAGEGNLIAAIDAYRTAARYDPTHQPALCEWWLAAEKLGLVSDAVAAGRRYMAIRPEHREARWDLALQELALGDLGPGWEGYAARWSHPHYATWRYDLPALEWAGEDLTGKHILVWREQGVGDEILFASCLPDLIAVAGHVTVACTGRLVSLYARSFPQADVIDARRITPPAVEPIAIDYHCAAGALPGFFRPTIASFPARAAYLTPDATRVRTWRERLATLPPGLRVGISWRSSMMTADRARGYATLDQWGPLLQTPGAVFINLQYDECALALATAEDQFDVHVHSWPDLDLRDDFEGSAALISNLDLVITIGNAVGELGGALGVPTWRLSPSPLSEWTMLGTSGRPWFPTMRLWQATDVDDWGGLVSRVAEGLRDLVARDIARAAA